MFFFPVKAFSFRIMTLRFQYAEIQYFMFEACDCVAYAYFVNRFCV